MARNWEVRVKRTEERIFEWSGRPYIVSAATPLAAGNKVIKLVGNPTDVVQVRINEVGSTSYFYYFVEVSYKLKGR